MSKNCSLFLFSLLQITFGFALNSGNSFEQFAFDVEAFETTDPDCSIRLVESIPEGLTYNESGEWNNMRTFKAWTTLLHMTEEKLDLASSYWSLRGQDLFEHPSDWQGEEIFKLLSEAPGAKNIKIRIAENLQANPDTPELANINGIEVRALNFTHLMGAGILHTKLWISDNSHFYVGSANFDWRSLTQVKELGILALNCPTLAQDMSKIFEVYWMLGGPGKSIPKNWTDDLETSINAENPLQIPSARTSVYLSSSPPPFCPKGREVDIEAILKVMTSANEYIHIAVMDYSPTFLYTSTHEYWPIIENQLRKAIIERGVSVRLLFSLWDHTKENMKFFMKSLASLNGINGSKVEAKFFKVPSFTPDQAEIPYARVNHNKYMVTDKHGYIGTSNWSADYFVSTGGIGFVFSKPEQYAGDSIYDDLNGVFNRDWSSRYALEM